MTLQIVALVTAILAGILALSLKPTITKGEYVLMWLIALVNIVGNMIG